MDFVLYMVIPCYFRKRRDKSLGCTSRFSTRQLALLLLKCFVAGVEATVCYFYWGSLDRFAPSFLSLKTLEL